MTAAAEEKMRSHQSELERKQREATLKRLAAQGVDKGFKGSEVKEGKYQSYSDPSQFPSEARTAKTVYVDAANESILCPMVGGQMVPFHIQTMKNAHKSEENGWFYLRLQFNVPAPTSTSAAAVSAVPSWADPNSKFIRELTYRTKTQQLNKAFFDIQELRKRVTARLKEHQARSSLVDQEDLKVDLRKGPVAKLKDLQIKPQLAGRKGNAGFLEAHSNGFRFISSQKLKIDIIYKNIKHAFFQPAEKSTLNVLMHFELHNPIMLGKKKAKKTNVSYPHLCHTSSFLS
jgi:nucleosome binding factor SPN SPT16 subunit